MNQLVRQVALVSEVDSIGFDEVAVVAAALNKQAVRDFGPIWGVDATVDGFARLEDVPVGYWPVIIETDIHQDGAAGFHTDKHGQPFALVQADTNWSLTASHETVEMLADPFGNRLVVGASPMQNQGRVEFLVEVADPCEGDAFAYKVNEVLVSDFYTPSYFDPESSQGVRYDFTGNISQPREVLNDGYLSWHDPVSDHWFQKTMFGGQEDFPDLGIFTDAMAGKFTLREFVDRKTVQPYRRLASVYRAEVAEQGAAVVAASLRGKKGLIPQERVQQLRRLIASFKGRRGGAAAGGGAAGPAPASRRGGGRRRGGEGRKRADG